MAPKPGDVSGYSPVVALTIVDCEPNSPSYGNLLVVIRDPITNATHPNTVSVPTQRVPRALIEALKSTSLGTSKWSSNSDVSGHSPVIFVVESLLARKFMMGDVLEGAQLSLEVRFGTLQMGQAEYGPNCAEPIAMANLLVRVTSGVSLFPRRSSSYREIRWVDPDEFLDALNSRAALTLFPLEDPLALCIHGLCVSTAARLIESGAVAAAAAT